MQSGRRESPREGRARGRWTDTQKKRETDNSQDCWGGIWWTDVCVCELMEESSSLRGPELTFAHKESSLWRAAQTDTEPEASLHSALLNKQRVCVSHKPLGRKLSQGNVIYLPKYHKTPPLSLDPQPNSNIHFSLSQRNHTDDIDVYLLVYVVFTSPELTYYLSGPMSQAQIHLLHRITEKKVNVKHTAFK